MQTEPGSAQTQAGPFLFLQLNSVHWKIGAVGDLHASPAQPSPAP